MVYESITRPNLWTLRPAYGYSGRTALEVTGTVKSIVVRAGFVYEGCDTGSALARKLNADTMALVGATASMTGNTAAMCYDALNNHIIIATTENPARIYIKDMDLVNVGSLVLNSGEGTVKAMIHDGTYLYVVCGTSPSKIVVLTTNATNPVRTGAVTLSAGENAARSIDHDGLGTVYVGCATTPAQIVKVFNTAGVPARVNAITLSIGGVTWGNAAVVAYDRYNANGKLYALAGSASQLEVLFQINPLTMDILNAAGGRFSGLTFTNAVLDTLSSNPGKYIYATAYNPAISPILGITEAWDIGSQNLMEMPGLRSSRRFTMNYPDSEPWGLAFDGTYLYIGSNTSEPVPYAIKFDRTYLGLTLYLRDGITYHHPIYGEDFPIVGLGNPITRTYGTQGRVYDSMVHLVIPKDTFDYTRLQAEEDMATVLNCVPYGFMHDWGTWGRAVAHASAPQMQNQGPHVNLAEITLNFKETAI